MVYKKILVSTDGSELSAAAEAHAISLAKAVGADLVAVSVTSPNYSGVVGEAMAYAADLEKQAALKAKSHLARIGKAAAELGLKAELIHVTDLLPYEGIVQTAEAQQCDLIVMASHGWRGLQRLLLGSEAQKVLIHSTIPVLIYKRA